MCLIFKEVNVYEYVTKTNSISAIYTFVTINKTRTVLTFSLSTFYQHFFVSLSFTIFLASHSCLSFSLTLFFPVIFMSFVSVDFRNVFVLLFSLESITLPKLINIFYVQYVVSFLIIFPLCISFRLKVSTFSSSSFR